MYVKVGCFALKFGAAPESRMRERTLLKPENF